MKTETLKSYDLVRLKSVGEEIRKELSSLRMDVFTEKAKKSGSLTTLRKNLARTLTIINEKKNK